MWELLLVLYIITFVALLYSQVRVINDPGSLTITLICRVWFIIIQFGLPMILILNHFLLDNAMGINGALIDYDDTSIMVSYVVYILSLASFGALCLVRRPLVDLSRIRVVGIATINRTLATAVVCVLIGAVSMVLWSKAYGSIFNLIKVGNAVRGGWDNTPNPLAMFKHPSGLLLFGSYLLLSLIVANENHKKVTTFILFIISVFLSMLFLLANDGRLSMAFYFVGLFLVFFYSYVWVKKKKFGIKQIVILVCVAFSAAIIMLNMDDFTFFVRNGSWPVQVADNQGNSLVKELLFDAASDRKVVGLVLLGNQPPLLVHDIVYGITAWLPTFLKPEWSLRLWSVNTMNFSSTSSGEMPCSLFAQGMYDLGFIGPIVLCYLFAKLVAWVDKNIGGKISNPFKLAVYSYIGLQLFRVVSYGMIYDFILNIFPVAVAYVIYGLIGLLVRKKFSKNNEGKTIYGIQSIDDIA